MAMGRPVIAANVGALPEIVLAPPMISEAARTGWLAEPDDPVSFARAIAAALAIDHTAYGLIATRARRMANQLFAPARVASATLGLYASLLEGR
jgi:glycosyltransferase involved in cell wall biosynthesis